MYDACCRNLGGTIPGLLDDLTTPPEQCAFAAALTELPDDETLAVLNAVAGEAWRPVDLKRVLAVNGVTVSHQDIGRHRRKECTACL